MFSLTTLGCDNPSPLTAADPIGEYPVWGQDFQKKTPTAGTSMLTATGGHGDMAAGKTIFLNNCALCHGPDAKGKMMPGLGQVPDLTAAALQSRLSDAQIRTTVKSGKGKMPPLGAQLSDKKIADVAAYVRSLNVGATKGPAKKASDKDATKSAPKPAPALKPAPKPAPKPAAPDPKGSAG